ncbi:MAG: hypothetical protein AAB336_07315, partial [Acidobacteriota bacterium]
KALAKNRENRYQSAKEFATDLKNLCREFGFSDSDGFLTGQFQSVSNTTSDIKLLKTQEAKTLIQNSVSAELLNKTGGLVAQKSLTIKKRNWFIPLAIVGMACLIAVGAYFYSPTNSNSDNLDSLEISTIANSDKAFAPSISPDGKYLGYVHYENGKKSLVVRQVVTGSTVTLFTQIENEAFLPPTFSPDGNYLYYVLADKGVGTLYQIPSLGGSPKKLINDVDSKVTFSPDGKEIAFRRRDAETGVESIFIANSDGTNEKSFISSKDAEVKGFNEVAWSPKGDNLLVSGVGDILLDELVKTKIMLVSLTDKKIKRFGDKDWLNANSFYWTKNNDSVLMLAKSNDQEPAQIWQISYPSGSDAKRITNDSSGYEMFSFASQQGIITGAKQNTISSLWSFNPATKELNQITSDSKVLLGAAGFEIMPNGKFLLTKIDSNRANLVTLNVDGKDEKSLTNEEGFNGQAVITPDGRFIVYTSAKGKHLSLWRFDVENQSLQQLTNPENEFDGHPQITSDGKTIIFERKSFDLLKSTLYKMPIEGGEITPMLSDSQQVQILPRLSDDGKLFVYSTMSFDKAKTRFDRSVNISAIEGSRLGKQKKEFNTFFGQNYRFTPDGKYLTHINQKGVPNIYNIPLDGSVPKQITNFNSGHIINFVWSKDGKKLYLVRAIINSELVLLKNTKG